MNKNRITYGDTTNNSGVVGQYVGNCYNNIQRVIECLQSPRYNTLYIILDGVIISKVKIK